MEKNIKKKNVYMCVSHFAVQQRLAQHYKSTILQKKKIWFQKTKVTKSKSVPIPDK